MIDNQKSRRNLTAFSRGILESKAIEILSKQAKEKQSAAGAKFGKGLPKKEEIALCNIAQSYEPKETPKTELKIDVKKELATRIGVGERTASKILNVNKHIEKAIEENKTVAGKKPEELKKELMSGSVTVNEAYNKIKLEEKKETIKQAERIVCYIHNALLCNVS